MVRKKRGFTIIELMVVISIIAILISILLPSLAAARDRGRYARWAGYSHSMRVDSELIIYYNFEQQNPPTQTNKTGASYVKNQAGGANHLYDQGWEPEDFKGQLGCTDAWSSCPTTTETANTAPKWNHTDMRWRGKGGLIFDGTDDLVAIGALSIDKQEPARAISVMAWVMTENSSQKQIICAFDASESFRFKIGSNLKPQWITSSPAARHEMIAGDKITTGQWHLIVGTYDADVPSDRKKLFVDGEEVKVADDPHSQEALGKGKRFGFLGVGSEAKFYGGKPGPFEYFDGMIDEFGIFHRALTPSQIDEMYMVGAPRERG